MVTGEGHDGMPRRALRFLGCWTLVSAVVAIALGRAIRRSRRDERRERPHG